MNPLTATETASETAGVASQYEYLTSLFWVVVVGVALYVFVRRSS